MSNKITASEGILALILLFCVALPLEVFLNAWVITKLWSWFIIPQFGLSVLSYVNAAGFALFVGVLTHQDLSEIQKKESDDSIWSKTIVAFFKIVFKPLFVLALAKFIIWIL